MAFRRERYPIEKICRGIVRASEAPTGVVVFLGWLSLIFLFVFHDALDGDGLLLIPLIAVSALVFIGLGFALVWLIPRLVATVCFLPLFAISVSFGIPSWIGRLADYGEEITRPLPACGGCIDESLPSLLRGSRTMIYHQTG